MTSESCKNAKLAQRVCGEEEPLIQRKTTTKRRKDLQMFNYMKFDYEQREKKIHIKPHHLDHDDELDTKEILQHLLHSKPIHLTVIGLVVLGTIFVLIGILIDVDMIKIDERTSIVPDVLHGFSIAILTVFVVEISMKLYADRQHQQFLDDKIEIFDAVVVVISFTLAITTAFLNMDKLHVAVGVLIMLRLWRVLRVINGIIVAVRHHADRELKIAEGKMEKLQKQNHQLRETVMKQKEAVVELVEILADRGIIVGGEFLDSLLQ